MKAFEDVDVTLFAEGKGIFDVIVDGTLLFSKYETHRFPNPDEIPGLIRG